MRTVPTHRRVLALSLFLASLWPTASFARLLQIIHTNDLHAHFERSEKPERGGYAQIKAVIDSLRQRAAESGVESLVVDGGDFSDGTVYRYADGGMAPYQIMDAMGYDAVGIGNHDWLIGADQMNRLVGRVRPKTPLVSANFAFDDRQKELAKYVRPYVSLEKAGSKIAVIGVTTDQFIYSWRVEDGTISDPEDTTEAYMEMLRKDHDNVIVLSHLGYKNDLKLADKLKGIDLIIGAHSHTQLKTPSYKSDRKVPIVQTGSTGEYVGDLLVDVEPGKPLKVVHYELVEVRADGPQDAEIAAMVSRAHSQLQDQYGQFGGNWLNEVVGYSEVPLASPVEGATVWGGLFAEALRETARAPASLDMSEFYGTSQPAGPVTREAIYNYYPRTFSIDKPFGWTVWKMKAPGWLIKLVIEQAAKMGSHVNTAGISYKVKWKKGKPDLYDFKIAGRRVIGPKIYTIGVSEGLGRGTSEISKLLSIYFRPRDTGVPVWHAVEEKLRQLGGPVQ